MKKMFVFIVSLVLSLSLTACNSGDRTQSSAGSQSAEETVRVSSGSLAIEVPADWRVSKEEDGKTIYPEFGGGIDLRTDDLRTDDEVDFASMSLGEFYAAYIISLTDDSSMSVTIKPEQLNVGKAAAIRTQLSYNTDKGLLQGWNELIISGYNVYSVTFFVPESIYEDKADLILNTLDSITVSDSEVPMFDASSNQDASSKNDSQDDARTQDEESLSQANAVKKAKEYLSFTAFSHTSLVNQLEYEGFSHDAAVYGADNCGANWTEQASKKAKEYLNFATFSYNGLVKQLEYEGFSHDDAVHSADNCGADWNEQAAKKAKEYLDISSFSHSGLVKQLEYEGFTEEQAEYGVSAVGL